MIIGRSTGKTDTSSLHQSQQTKPKIEPSKLSLSGDKSHVRCFKDKTADTLSDKNQVGKLAHTYPDGTLVEDTFKGENVREFIKKLKEKHKQLLKEATKRYNYCVNRRSEYYKYQAIMSMHEIEFLEDLIKHIDELAGDELI